MSASLDADMPSDLFYIINYANKFAIKLLDLTFCFTIGFSIAINRQGHTSLIYLQVTLLWQKILLSG